MSIPFHQFYQLSDTPMCVLNFEGEFQSLNAAFMQLIGDNGDTRNRLSDWWKESDHRALEAVLRGQSQVTRTVWATLIPANSRSVIMQWRFAHLPNTEYFFVEAHAWARSLLQTGTGDPLVPQKLQNSLKATNTLVTFQELINDALIQLAETLAEASYVVALHDPNSAEYVYVSPGIEQLMGFSPSELYGKTPYSYFHEEDLSKLTLDHRNKQKGEAPNQTLAFRRKMKDGSYRWSESISRPVTDHEGNVIFILSITRDSLPPNS